MSALVCLVLTILVQHLSTKCCSAEIVFHRRDHSDQLQLQPEQHINSVETYSDALKYLNKYGYLNCKTTSSPISQRLTSKRRTRTRRSVSVSSSSVIEGSRNNNICSREEVQRALLFLQETFNLRPTGRLDDQTKRTMSQGRCGNTDIDTTNNVDAMSRSLRRERSVSIILDQIPSSLNVDENLKRYKNSLFEPEESVIESNAMERRKKMLSTIKDKMHQQQQLVYVSRRNVTKHERRIMNWITSISKSAQRIQKTRRKKRSIKSGFVDRVASDTNDVNTRRRLTNVENRPVRWRLTENGISGRIPIIEQKAVLELSFRMWNEVIPLKFAEDNDRDTIAVDIFIAFGRETHWNCEKPFDGVGGELAHSWAGGDIHFDDDENYRKDGTDGIDLLKVAVHEVGHVLGLLHNERQHSIMYPIYVSPSVDEELELARDDRRAVQSIYGVCKGTFNVVFDWVRKKHDPRTNQAKYIYNTYFFRGNRYWMYENGHNRTRYGDPLQIESQWPRLPGNLDAFTQVVSPSDNSDNDYNIDTYFFKGDFYYRYDDENDRVMDGYPRRISQDFGPKPDFNESVPNQIDAVLFDSTIEDKPTIYFFKGDWVWLYDARQVGRNACCEAKRRFIELFPMAEANGSAEAALTGDVTSVYYSYAFQTTYIFKDEIVYDMRRSSSSGGEGDEESSTHAYGRLRKLSPWYNIWLDICDVE